MATYNGARYLGEQLDSLLSQTVPFEELIICDDCSNDNTLEILERYAKNDHRIKIYVNEKNLGFNKNFQKAIGLCEGVYIALCDQDDIWLPNHLKVLSELLDSGAWLGVGGTKFIDVNGNSLSELTMAQTRNFLWTPDTTNIEVFKFACGYMNPFQGASMMIRKEFLNIALPLPKSAYIYDVWFTLSASLLGVLGYNPEIISLWRRHGRNATNNLLHHSPLRTLFGHIVKPGSVNHRGELLMVMSERMSGLLPQPSQKLLDEALAWNLRRNSIIGRLKNSYDELRFWRSIHRKGLKG